MYKYMNKNPKSKNIEDCAIRAISVAEGISWDEAYIELSESARKMRLMMNSVEAIEEYLDKKYRSIPVYEKTVGEFIKNHSKGTYLITMPRTYYGIKTDGINFDTFDPSNREIWSAWRVK